MKLRVALVGTTRNYYSCGDRVASRWTPHSFWSHHSLLVASTWNAQQGPILIDVSRIEQKRASASPLLCGPLPALLLCSHGSARASKLPDVGWGGLSMHRLGRSAPVQKTEPLASRRISTRPACRRPRQRTAGGEKRHVCVAASREITAWTVTVDFPIERDPEV